MRQPSVWPSGTRVFHGEQHPVTRKIIRRSGWKVYPGRRQRSLPASPRPRGRRTNMCTYQCSSGRNSSCPPLAEGILGSRKKSRTGSSDTTHRMGSTSRPGTSSGSSSSAGSASIPGVAAPRPEWAERVGRWSSSGESLFGRAESNQWKSRNRSRFEMGYQHRLVLATGPPGRGQTLVR
jgi:hypothetical protein